MLHGTYRGVRADLKDEKALLMRNPDGSWLAQFDNLQLPDCLTHNWVHFKNWDFVLDVEPESPKVSDRYGPHARDCNCIECLPEPHNRFTKR